ncbi:MAG: hypothetical protein RDU89_10370 [bacterium]|nr:hypothetical protein [bacterium]
MGHLLPQPAVDRLYSGRVAGGVSVRGRVVEGFGHGLAALAVGGEFQQPQLGSVRPAGPQARQGTGLVKEQGGFGSCSGAAAGVRSLTRAGIE